MSDNVDSTTQLSKTKTWADILRGPAPKPEFISSNESATLKEKKPSWFLDFPPEIRNKIYESLLVRVADLEISIKFERKWVSRDENGRNIFKDVPRFTYKFVGFCIGRNSNKYEVSWTKRASEDIVKQIENGTWREDNPDTYKATLLSGASVRFSIKRAEGHHDIEYKQNLVVDKLQGLALLRTCKQVNTEASSILYGNNRYVFDTTGVYDTNEDLRAIHAPLLRRWDRGTGKATLWAKCIVREGQAMDTKQAIEFSNLTLNEEVLASTFVHRSRFLHFAREIGKDNFALLSTIKVKGGLKTADISESSWLDGTPTANDIGLARTLKYYAPFLRSACPNLGKLTIDITHVSASEGTQWDDDWRNSLRLTDSQRIDNMVKNLVTALPLLKELRLGEYNLGFQQRYLGEWEGALYWIDIVREAEAARREKPTELALGEVLSPEKK